MSRWALALAAFLLLAPGCRSLPTATPLPRDDTRAGRLLDALVARAASRHSLRGVARVSLDTPTGSSRSRQILVAERPARLRVEIQGLLNQLVAVLVSDGNEFQLFRASERSVERGEMHPRLLYDVAGLPLRPEAAVDVLLGVPGLGEHARPGSAALLSDGNVWVELEGDEGAELRRLRFDEEANLREFEVRTPAGALAWRALFDDYRTVDESRFAHDIVLDFPAVSARAEISFQRVELNPLLPPGIFALETAHAQEGGQGE